jgi:hypothetical protein
MYGTVAGIEIAVSDQATLGTGASAINLWQQNMVAIRAEVRIGFVADTAYFNKITA